MLRNAMAAAPLNENDDPHFFLALSLFFGTLE